jgi:hypothetical protein
MRNDIKEVSKINMVEWNAYYHCFNSDEFKKINILQEHVDFVKYVKKHKKKCKGNKEEFKENLRRELLFYFWAKCEWEVIVTKTDNRIIMTPWVGRNKNISLDVTDNEDFDWLSFYNWIKEQKCANQNGLIKIDIYDQVMFKFDEFTDYVFGIKRWVANR